MVDYRKTHLILGQGLLLKGSKGAQADDAPD